MGAPANRPPPIPEDRERRCDGLPVRRPSERRQRHGPRGFVGLGRAGLSNMVCAALTPGAAVGAVCDINQPAVERARAQARQLGCSGIRAFQDFRELLADPSIDAVSLATSDPSHASMAIEACEAARTFGWSRRLCVHRGGRRNGGGRAEIWPHRPGRHRRAFPAFSCAGRAKSSDAATWGTSPSAGPTRLPEKMHPAARGPIPCSRPGCTG